LSESRAGSMRSLVATVALVGAALGQGIGPGQTYIEVKGGCSYSGGSTPTQEQWELTVTECQNLCISEGPDCVAYEFTPVNPASSTHQYDKCELHAELITGLSAGDATCHIQDTAAAAAAWTGRPLLFSSAKAGVTSGGAAVAGSVELAALKAADLVHAQAVAAYKAATETEFTLEVKMVGLEAALAKADEAAAMAVGTPEEAATAAVATAALAAVDAAMTAMDAAMAASEKLGLAADEKGAKAEEALDMYLHSGATVDLAALKAKSDAMTSEGTKAQAASSAAALELGTLEGALPDLELAMMNAESDLALVEPGTPEEEAAKAKLAAATNAFESASFNVEVAMMKAEKLAIAAEGATTQAEEFAMVYEEVKAAAAGPPP